MSLLEFHRTFKHSYSSETTIIPSSYTSLTEAPCESGLLEDKWAKDECFKSPYKLGNSLNKNCHLKSLPERQNWFIIKEKGEYT